MYNSNVVALKSDASFGYFWSLRNAKTGVFGIVDRSCSLPPQCSSLIAGIRDEMSIIRVCFSKADITET